MRFLTPDAKLEILAEWQRTREQWRDGSLRGTGEPDTDIIPWCDRINALPGLCTLQSCAGHTENGSIKSAHFWIWMSRSVSENFDRNAFLLLRNRDRIDWVSRHYLPDGKEIASITFFGNERDLLEQSATLIYGFMCGIAEADT